MEKLPADKVPEENAAEVTEEVDSDDVLSEPAEMTDNTDSSNEASAPAEKKPEPSQMQSDDTSGIEIVSTSTTSESEIPCEGAAASGIAQPLPGTTEPVETDMVTSSSEIPCEGVADSDAEEKTEPSSMQTESVDELSQSVTSTAEIQSEGVASASAEDNLEILPIESEIVFQSIPSSSEVPCEQKASDSVNEKDATAASSETSPRAKKSGKILEKVRRFLSPKKSQKSKESRSKSMSPPEKTKASVTEDSNSAPEEARISSEGEEHVKNESGISSMFNVKSIKKTFSKLSIKIKSSGTESKSLVTSEAIERAVEPEVSKPEVETKCDPEQPALNKPQWTNNRTSLVEVQSLGGTTMTDVPSTSSSSVFSAASSRKPSAAGENTSEEAVAGSLISSPEEQTTDTKEDKEAGNEGAKKDGPSSEEESNEVGAAEDANREQSSSGKTPKCPDSKDEGKPESEN